MAKLDSSSLKAEVGAELSQSLGSFAHDRKFESGACGNFLFELDNGSRDVIARGLDKLGPSRPGDLTVIAHPPRLAKDSASLNLSLVGETFLYEACRVACSSFGVFRTTFPGVKIGLGGDLNLSLGLCFCSHPFWIFELANKFCRGLLLLSDFE